MANNGVVDLLLEYRDNCTIQAAACYMYASELKRPASAFAFMSKLMPLLATGFLALDMSDGSGSEARSSVLTGLSAGLSAILTGVNFSITYFQFDTRVAKLLQHANGLLDVKNDIVFVIHRKDFTEATAMCLCERITSIQRQIEIIPEHILTKAALSDQHHQQKIHQSGAQARMDMFEGTVMRDVVASPGRRRGSVTRSLVRDPRDPPTISGRRLRPPSSPSVVGSALSIDIPDTASFRHVVKQLVDRRVREQTKDRRDSDASADPRNTGITPR